MTVGSVLKATCAHDWKNCLFLDHLRLERAKNKQQKQQQWIRFKPIAFEPLGWLLTRRRNQTERQRISFKQGKVLFPSFNREEQIQQHWKRRTCVVGGKRAVQRLNSMDKKRGKRLSKFELKALLAGCPSWYHLTINLYCWYISKRNSTEWKTSFIAARTLVPINWNR